MFCTQPPIGARSSARANSMASLSNPAVNRREHLPVRHAKAMVLAKRAMSALGAAEAAIRQLDELLAQGGQPEDSHSRHTLASLKDHVGSLGISPESETPPGNGTDAWLANWDRAMLDQIRKEGERAAQQGLQASNNPYADDDPDSRAWHDAWREGFKSILGRRQIPEEKT